jgi:hypothetical protein
MNEHELRDVVIRALTEVAPDVDAAAIDPDSRSCRAAGDSTRWPTSSGHRSKGRAHNRALLPNRGLEAPVR